MAEKLTPQQRQAVEDRGGRLLVSAAAGSGKTKVLVDRLLKYLNDPASPANLDDFLIITYTKAAASELRGKIAAKLTEAIAVQPENRHLQQQMQRLFLTKISTVHGFCGDLLREFAYKLDLSADFRVADENECRELRETVLSELLDRAYESAGENSDFRAFVDTQGLGRTDKLVSEIIMKVYDSARCHLNPEQWLDGCLKDADVEDVSEASLTVWGRFLMDDLFSYLDGQIAVIAKCAELAEAADGMQKPAAVLRDTLHQLTHLRAAATWDEIIARKSIDYGRLTFPRKGIDAELAERIKACRTGCKKGLEKRLRSFADDSEQVLQDLAQSAAGVRGLIALVRQFGEDYDRAKRSRRCVDFGDLEHKTLDLLLGTSRSGPTAVSREIARRFREIMVDEYQDSNGVQDAIFMALTEQRQNCFMVGDVKQSIYQFRLADPGIFLKKYHDYVHAEDALPGMGRKIMLNANFRSGGEVISAVNDVFTDCMSPQVGGLVYGEDEMLREGIAHIALPDAAIELYGIDVQEDTYEEESGFTAQRIKELLDGSHFVRDGDQLRPIREEDIVILLRSPGSVGNHFQRALESCGIRCSIGGGDDLLQTQEIGVLRALLQTIVNPQQDIPLLATLASPLFSFTADDLAAIRSKNKRCSIYDALRADESAKSTAFLETLAVLRREARMNTIAQLIEKIFTLTRMDSIYAAMDGGEGKTANLQAFYQLAADFEATSRRELGQFLEHLDALEEKGLMTAAEAAGGCVTIMSIHKSKGLEFPVVFLCGLGREFNRESLRAQVLCDKELGLGLSVADAANRIRYPAISKRAIVAKTAAESLSEEMRVLYVAMTRPKDRLIMTYAARNLQSDLQNLALRYDIGGAEQLTRDAVCPGEWVLLSALRRTEAGAFHALGGKPAQTRGSAIPWRIEIVKAAAAAEKATETSREEKKLPKEMIHRLQQALDFRYEHTAATLAPSKMTATQRKGRVKDQEAAEHTDESGTIRRNWRKPAFLGTEIQGKTYGSAIHAVMQYIRYENCADEAGVDAEIKRLVEQRFVTEEAASMADRRRIAAFFTTPVGWKLRKGIPYVREFKFSVLDDASHYGEGLEGEQVLLQGVVDCALIEEDGITVLDFKTDYVTEETLPDLVERYRLQVQTYGDAMKRIYGKPVKASMLYFFRLNRFVDV